MARGFHKQKSRYVMQAQLNKCA